MSEVFQIVYVSSATHPFSKEDLLSILRISRENNARVDVTGMLLYQEGNIIQVLEGPQERVLETYARIERDPRHYGIIPLTEGMVEAREFAEWSMAFRDLRSADVQWLPGFSGYLNKGFGALSPQEKTGAAHRLLQFFPRLAR